MHSKRKFISKFDAVLLDCDGVLRDMLGGGCGAWSEPEALRLKTPSLASRRAWRRGATVFGYSPPEAGHEALVALLATGAVKVFTVMSELPALLTNTAFLARP